MDPPHSVAPLSAPPTPNLTSVMQSKYAPSQAFLACCPFRSLSELHLRLLSRLSSGYILCSSQNTLLVLVFLLSIDLHSRFQRQCRWRQESRGSSPIQLHSGYYIKILQSSETQEVKYKKGTIATFGFPSIPFCPKSSQNPINDVALFFLCDNAFSHQVLPIKDDVSLSLLSSRIFFHLSLLCS